MSSPGLTATILLPSGSFFMEKKTRLPVFRSKMPEKSAPGRHYVVVALRNDWRFSVAPLFSFIRKDLHRAGKTGRSDSKD